MKVVIFGSIAVKTLPADACVNIDRIIALGAQILVGDAPGVDAEVQRYLERKGYRRTTVYYRGARARNNLGGFPTVRVDGSFTDRDRQMCAEAEYGLGIWDGRSPGSARNIEQLGTRCRVIRA